MTTLLTPFQVKHLVCHSEQIDFCIRYVTHYMTNVKYSICNVIKQNESVISLQHYTGFRSSISFNPQLTEPIFVTHLTKGRGLANG